MHIFTNGRSAFLEFLRNLTPQAVLLSLTIVAGIDLTPTCCYLDNTKQTLIMSCFFFMWITALWANTSIFIEKYLDSIKSINRASTLFSIQGITGFMKFKAVTLYIWRNKRIVFLEVLAVIIITEFGLVTVVMSAMSTASTLLNIKNG